MSHYKAIQFALIMLLPLAWLGCTRNKPLEPKTYVLDAVVEAVLETTQGELLTGYQVAAYYFWDGPAYYGIESDTVITDEHGRTRPPLSVRVWNDDPTGYFYLWAASSSDTFYSVQTYSFADNDTLRIIAAMRPAPEPPVNQ